MVLKKAWFKPYHYTISHNNVTYQIMVVSLSSKHQLTIHSKHVWNIQYGRVDGVRYKTLHKKLVYLSSFHQSPQPIYLFKQKPYKILQYLNESDIIDISDATEIHGVPLFYSMDAIKEHLS